MQLSIVGMTMALQDLQRLQDGKIPQCGIFAPAVMLSRKYFDTLQPNDSDLDQPQVGKLKPLDFCGTQEQSKKGEASLLRKEIRDDLQRAGRHALHINTWWTRRGARC